MATVYGPYWDKTAENFAVRWTDANGKRHSKRIRDKATALAFVAELRGGESSIALEPIDTFGGSASEFKQRISEAVIALNKAVRDGDAQAVELLRKYVRGLSEMASAIVPHAGYLELEERHAELVKFVEDLFAGRATVDAEKPAALGSLATTLPGRAGSDASVH